MKTLLLLLAAAGLSGCAVYPAPASYEVYGGGPPYVVRQPVYIEGGVTYAPYYGAYAQPYVYPRYYHPGYRAVPRAAPPRHGARPKAHPVRPGRGAHERGGDGVRKQHDRRPDDPGRR